MSKYQLVEYQENEQEEKKRFKMDLVPLLVLFLFMLVVYSLGNTVQRAGNEYSKEPQFQLLDSLMEQAVEADSDINELAIAAEEKGYEVIYFNMKENVVYHGELSLNDFTKEFINDLKFGKTYVGPLKSNILLNDPEINKAISIGKDELGNVIIVQKDFTREAKVVNEILRKFRVSQLIFFALAIATTIFSDKVLRRYKESSIVLIDNLMSLTGSKKKKGDSIGEVTDFMKRMEEIEGLLELYKEDNNSKIEELTNFSQEQDILLRNMSHEIKTPLSIIKMYTSLLEDDPNSTEAKGWLRIVNEESDKILSIVNNTLTITKEEYAGEEKGKEEINLSDYLLKKIESYSPKINEKGIRLDVDIDDDVIIEFNDVSLDYIVNNYVSNAIKYTEDDVIKISLKNSLFTVSNHAILENADTSILWNKFYRTDESRRKIDGENSVGLGLPIVKAVADYNQDQCWSDYKDNTISFNYRFKIKD